MSFLEWCQQIQQAEWLQASIYIVPGFNLVHLLSMSLFLGALLMVDLRLLGAVLTRRPLAEVARGAHPWLVGGFLGLAITGVPAWMATAETQYFNPVFHTKMWVLLAATMYTFILRPKVLQADETRVGPVWSKLVALVSISLWISIAVSARLIMLL